MTTSPYSIPGGFHQSLHNVVSPSDLPPQPAEVSPGVFLGGFFEANDHTLLAARGIDCVLNMAAEDRNFLRPYPAHFNILHLDALDSVDYDIFNSDMPLALEFIRLCLSEGRRVLVHCAAG